MGQANYFVGLFYMLAGAACLLWFRPLFVNPWPMGLVFLAGETTGGFIFMKDNNRGKETTP